MFLWQVTFFEQFELIVHFVLDNVIKSLESFVKLLNSISRSKIWGRSVMHSRIV